MTHTHSRSKIGLMALALLFSILIAATWFGRGLYDTLFLLEGHLVLVNATAEDHKAKVTFPSGEVIEVDLKSGAASQTLVGKTGEGSIDITIDGVRSEKTGYVTSMNGMILLTIDEARVVFSQVSL